MVKGLSRRVVVLRFPDAGVFEQAIFMVREDAETKRSGSADALLREACQIAREHSPEPVPRRRLPLYYTLLGGGIVGLMWIASEIVLSLIG